LVVVGYDTGFFSHRYIGDVHRGRTILIK
jgi:hypothetical protein